MVSELVPKPGMYILGTFKVLLKAFFVPKDKRTFKKLKYAGLCLQEQW